MKQIATALLKAQKEMGNAFKGAKNPFFKSSYADLNSIREACMPALNNNGIVVLQPTVVIDGKNYVKTMLLHESGESLECVTEILYKVAGDAQGQGSGISYARRYGLQSFVNIGASDDDGESAMARNQQPSKSENQPQPLDAKLFEKYNKLVNECESLAELEASFNANKDEIGNNKAIITLFGNRKMKLKS